MKTFLPLKQFLIVKYFFFSDFEDFLKQPSIEKLKEGGYI
jgi:hypothetical protein